jgi:hypothetical protein
LNRSDAALVRITSPRHAADDGLRGAEERAVEFVKTVFPTLGIYLPS